MELMALVIYKRFNANAVYRYREKMIPQSEYKKLPSYPDIANVRSYDLYQKASLSRLAESVYAYASYRFNADKGTFILSNYRSFGMSEKTIAYYPREDSSTEGNTYKNTQTNIPRTESKEILAITTNIAPSSHPLSHGYKAERYLDRYEKGSYIDDITAEDGTYPDNGQQGNYFYERVGFANRAPYISGNSLDLGSKTSNFDIEYIVTDEDGDSVTVDIFVDDIKKESAKKVSLGYKYTFAVDISNLYLGTHTVKIIAKDSQGVESSPRVYTFNKTNSAPIISGQDEDLGGKSTAFTQTFTVTDNDGDNVDLTIHLDSLEISSRKSVQGNELLVTITDDMLKKLATGSRHTILITAMDGQGGVTYRRYTFTKTNRPPIISDSNQDLGTFKDKFDKTFQISDDEKDPVNYEVRLDTKLIASKSDIEFKDYDNKDFKVSITGQDWLTVPYGKHKIEISAWDSESVNTKQKRTWTIERIPDGLDVEIKLGQATVAPKKIISVPHGLIQPDAIQKVLVCNNYLDDKPTWEDATEMSKIARAYTFTNTTKTAEFWCIGINVIINNGQSGLSSILRGQKGGYE